MAEIVIPGDAGGLAALASQLGAAGEHVGSVRGRVDSNGLQGGWTGRAADAFRSTLHELPGELTKVEQAFDDAGRALGSFSSKLADLQQRAGWYNGQIEAAQRELEAAESGKHGAEAELRTAKQRSGAATDPVSKHAAQGAVTAGESAVGRASAAIESSVERISGFERAGSQLHQEYEDAVRACAAALDRCGQAGHHSLLGWAKAKTKEIGKLAERGAGAVIHTAKGAVEDITDGDALEAFDKHWGDWRKVLVGANDVIGDVAVAVGAGLGVVAAGALVVPVFGEAASAALLTADAAFLKGAGALQTAGSGLILAGDLVDGEVMGRAQYRSQIFDDSVNVAVSAAGGKLADRAIHEVGPEVESMPAFKTATGKLEKVIVSSKDPETAAKVVDKGAEVVKDEAVDRGEDFVRTGFEALPRSVILEPFEEPETLMVNFAPALALN